MIIRKIGLLGRTYRHMQRYRDILGVLFKFGFDDLVVNLKVEQYLDLGRQIFTSKARVKVEALSRAQRMRMAIEELGPTFIKLGQILSTRPDLLPADFMAELQKLQDEVPPFPYEEVEKIITWELKGPLEATFEQVDPHPLAAASIGQVHRARLLDGEDVVIKVQRPGIRPLIEVDLEILLHLAMLMEKHLEGWDIQRPTAVIEEFGHTLERELDYLIEANHMERFAAQFIGEPRIYVPKIFRDASTSRILTMEYVQGIKSNSLDLLEAAGYDLPELADRGADLVLLQIFEHGFFHADPHPGNLVVLPNSVICFLDMGMMGRVDRTSRERIVDLIMAVVRQDMSAVVESVLRITVWEDEPDRRALEREASEFLDQYLFKPLKELELGSLFENLFQTFTKYRLRVPADLLLLLKALTSMEGLGRRLNPDFDMIDKAAPFVRRVQLQRLHPRRLAEDIFSLGTDMLSTFREMPGEALAVLRLARHGRLRIEFEHKGLDPMLINQDRTSNRLAFAIVLASLVIGSSLVILAGIPPKWHDIPIIGLAGYLVAGVMGFWLLISILRRGML